MQLSSSEWEALVTLNKREWNTIATLVKDPAMWEAFMLILKHEEAKIFWQLGRSSAEELTRKSGQFELIQNLKKLREMILNVTN